MLDWIVDVVLGPLQLLGFEVLRRPLEFTLAAVVGVGDRLVVPLFAGGDGHLQSVGRQTLPHVTGELPAHDAAGVDIEDDCEVTPALPGTDIGEV